jgi:hypothetical protein
MADSLCFRRIGLALFAVITFLLPAVRAKEFTSNQYGFQISLPPGFREQRADVVNIIAEFIEPQSDIGVSPIIIGIGHTGSNYNPADNALSTKPSGQNGSTSSRDTRQWKDLKLQVIRQELAVSSSDLDVNYAIVFPLADEGIVVRVRGQKSREKEVVKVFDSCIRQFVNMKPYVAVSGNAVSGGVAHNLLQVLTNILLPVVTGALVLFWIARVRKARLKAVSPNAPVVP